MLDNGNRRRADIRYRTAIAGGMLLCLAFAPECFADTNWSASFGPGIVAFPRYPGARAESIWPVPAADFRYGEHLFFDTRNGLGLTWLNEPNLRMGASVWFRGGRHHDDGATVAALEGIKTAAKAQVFASSVCGHFALDTTIARDLGGSDGLTVDVMASLRFTVTARLYASVGVNASAANRQFMQTWFGITPEQSAVSGLPQYSTGGGMKSLGPVISVNYGLTSRWSLQAAIEYDALLVKAANSPVVERRALPVMGLAVVYHLHP